MTNEKTATVLSKEPEGNVFKMRDVDLLKSRKTTADGRFYTSETLIGKWVRFAMKENAMVDTEHTEKDVDVVEMNDLDVLNTKKVLPNGHLHLGEQYADTDATVALRVVEDPNKDEEQPEATKHSESVTVHS